MLGSIAFAIIQNNAFSLWPTVFAILFSFVGFGLAIYARRKNKKDILALLLVLGNVFIWVGYAVFLIYMAFFWRIQLF